jgi:hypothetical protein
MYTHYPNLLLGFHGCKRSVYDEVLKEFRSLSPSTNSYDWLGSGIYFWENSYARALDWANSRYRDAAAVIGVVADLGHCLNLTDFENSEIIEKGYLELKRKTARRNIAMPYNKNVGVNDDWLIRELDCAVVNQTASINEEIGKEPFDSVRGIFAEGKPIYPGAGFRGKTHVQICIRNSKCIKGYFAPLDMNGQVINF